VDSLFGLTSLRNMGNKLLPEKVLVVICTHNPKIEKLRGVIECLNSNNSNLFRFLIIDNASDNSREIKALCNSESYLFEAIKGNSFARKLALEQLQENELLIFVDDDNYIGPNYIEVALVTARQHPDWGCFGGNSYASHELRIAKWKLSLLPYLAITNKGSEKLDEVATLSWSSLEPVGAGMCLRFEVRESFLNTLKSSNVYFQLGRSGKNLLSGEDSYIARMTHFRRMKYGFNPNLRLIHDIKPERIGSIYLAKLLYSYGKSDVILDQALSIKPSYPYPPNLIEAVGRYFYYLRKGRAGAILGLRQLGQYVASWQIKKKNPD
jgi:glycosyltransferase involved in cell wall biosynthesis